MFLSSSHSVLHRIKSHKYEMTYCWKRKYELASVGI